MSNPQQPTKMPGPAPSPWQFFFTEWLKMKQVEAQMRGDPNANKLNIAQAAKEAGQEYVMLTPEQKEPYVRRSQMAKEARNEEIAKLTMQNNTEPRSPFRFHHGEKEQRTLPSRLVSLTQKIVKTVKEDFERICNELEDNIRLLFEEFSGLGNVTDGQRADVHGIVDLCEGRMKEKGPHLMRKLYDLENIFKAPFLSPPGQDSFTTYNPKSPKSTHDATGETLGSTKGPINIATKLGMSNIVAHLTGANKRVYL
ncbi:hypothetical protein BD410DRAFT_795524 [Rickenella mellea]|uniref:HMG box domain-containing protein n=1 Tax=Rickenella mellea TaxID=50990 RepID=A0A4Y7PGE7_9AGAM|nr:hypothetical protein BD410DRAFT_797199 [Rickenella mellea]TDL16250.1 hypothetical protein BD410DRAFT_795524 [Rickenella mellea]